MTHTSDLGIVELCAVPAEDDDVGVQLTEGEVQRAIDGVEDHIAALGNVEGLERHVPAKL